MRAGKREKEGEKERRPLCAGGREREGMKGGRRMKKAGDRWPFQTMRNSRDKGSARARAALCTDIAAPGKKRVNAEERREMADKEERAKRREGGVYFSRGREH